MCVYPHAKLMGVMLTKVRLTAVRISMLQTIALNHEILLLFLQRELMAGVTLLLQQCSHEAVVLYSNVEAEPGKSGAR